MDRTGKIPDGDHAQLGERYIAKMAFMDLKAGDRFAIAFVGPHVELARAAIVAAAIAEFGCLDLPFSQRGHWPSFVIQIPYERPLMLVEKL
jgi:hypothetical protein